MRSLLCLISMLLATACGVVPNRPVSALEARASIVAFSEEAPRTLPVSLGFVAAARDPGSPASAPVSAPAGESLQLALARSLVARTPAPPYVLPTSNLARPAPPARLLPADGPLDVGLPLLVDLGAGEAPFDDGAGPLHPGATGRGGFSDSVLSITYRQPVGRWVHLLGTAAVEREQDLAILESLPGARFAFAVIGIGASF